MLAVVAAVVIAVAVLVERAVRVVVVLAVRVAVVLPRWLVRRTAAVGVAGLVEILVPVRLARSVAQALL